MGSVDRLALDSAARRCWDSVRMARWVVGLAAAVVVVVVAAGLVLGEVVAALTVAPRMQACLPGTASRTCDVLAAVQLHSLPRRLLPDVDDALAKVVAI